jgi:dCMP deaminase
MWDERFAALALHVAQWSKDPSTKVGAVIVDSLRVVRGVGYNGFPRGVKDLPERYLDRPTKYKLVVHAEANALLNSSGGVRGCTLYCTWHPCSACAALIVQAGIAEIHCPAPDPRWAEDAMFARMIFGEAGVAI